MHFLLYILGYILTYKDGSGQWHETQLPPSRRDFVLESLQCGTAYHIALVGFNSVGRGEPSDIIQVSTDGRGIYFDRGNGVGNSKNIFFIISHFLYSCCVHRIYFP